MTAGFELERFAWADGAFEVGGRWSGEPGGPLGRARLVVEVDGRRRRIGGQGPRPHAAPGGAGWRGRFPCPRPAVAGPAELEVGGTLVIELPPPALPPEPAGPDLTAAAVLLERLEAAGARLAREREAAERAAGETAERVAREVAERVVPELAARAAAEAAERAALEAAGRIAAERAGREPEPVARAEGPPAAPLPPPTSRPTTPRREAIREALERPREPRGVLGRSPVRRRLFAFVVAALIVGVVVLLLLLLL